MKRALVAAAVAFVVLAAQTAHADPESEAQEHFKRGVKLYNLGHFQEAIPEFEKAYDFDPQPILLFNIAQSHRQNGNKERALFFYRRYLEQEPNTTKRADVEQRMKELAQALQQENEQKQKPPTEVTPPPPTTGPSTPSGPTTPPVVTGGPPPPASAVPVRLALALGPSFASLSTQQSIELPVLFGLELGASYDFLHGPSELRAGVEMLYASLPYNDIAAPTPSTRRLSGERSSPSTTPTACSSRSASEAGSPAASCGGPVSPTATPSPTAPPSSRARSRCRASGSRSTPTTGSRPICS